MARARPNSLSPATVTGQLRIMCMTNDQRLKIVTSVKQLLGLAGENAAPEMISVIAAAIIHLSRVEDLLM